MSGPATFTHAGAGEERQRRTREALEKLAAMDGEDIQIETGSGNVFADLGFDDPEAEMAKADARIAAGDLAKVREVTIKEWEAEMVAGASDGTRRPPQLSEEESAKLLIEADMVWLWDEGPITTDAVISVYAAAQRVMVKAGPLPLAAPEPWAMPDDEYWASLIEWAPCLATDDWREINEGMSLDEIGKLVRRPRPRLVLVANRESDDAYAKRLGVDDRLWAANASGCLDALGAEMGVPRARLVPMEGEP